MMNTPQDKLLRAIGEIDDKYVEEAASPYKKAKIAYIFTSKATKAIAATFVCAIITVFAIVMLQPKLKFDDIFDVGIGGNAQDKDNYPNADMVPNLTLTVKGATLTLIDATDTRYFYSLVISEEQNSIDFSIRGKSPDGTPVIATTLDEVPTEYTKISLPKITVDGESVEKLPTKIGSYSITIDLTELQNAGYSFDDFIDFYPFVTNNGSQKTP